MEINKPGEKKLIYLNTQNKTLKYIMWSETQKNVKLQCIAKLG